MISLAAQEVLSKKAKNGSIPVVLACYHDLGHAFATRGKIQCEMIRMQKQGKKNPALFAIAAEAHHPI
jgi:hypothetical protein